MTETEGHPLPVEMALDRTALTTTDASLVSAVRGRPIIFL